MSRPDLSWLDKRSRDRFEVLRMLGCGGMGTVFLAHDHMRRQDVALKTLSQLNGNNVYKFKQEFRSLTNIIHKNLVTLYELLVLDENWFFTMTHVDGVSFLEHVRPHHHLLPSRVANIESGQDLVDIQQPVPLSEVLGNTQNYTLCTNDWEDTADTRDYTLEFEDNTLHDIDSDYDPDAIDLRRSAIETAQLDVTKLRLALPQLATGLHALHQAGKLHRDIKPNNILVTPEGQVCLVDFGLVVDTSITKEMHKREGTPAYMSPEQVTAKTTLGPASDWYSFGVVLYEALTGRFPFEGPMQKSMKARCQQDGPLPSRTGCTIPADLEKICTRLLKLSPEARPSGEEVLGALGSDKATYEIAQTSPGEEATSFVGREQALGNLFDAYNMVRNGHNVAAMVHGPSGIGKSVLIEHFLDQLAQSDEVMIFRGRCYERESVPFKALDSLVDGLSHTLLELSPERRKQILPRDLPALARLFPTVQQLSKSLDDTTVEVQDAQELRHRAFTALRYLLRMLSVDSAIVIYVDDLQWGDMDSAPFLVDLVHHPQTPPLLFLASFRTDEAVRCPLIQKIRNPGTGIKGDLRDIPLTALNQDEAENLALQLMGEATNNKRQIAQTIVQESAGNPMFISELALSVREFGKVGQDLQLDEVIQERIRSLPDDARALLTTASVAGRPLPIQVLSQASEIEGEASTLAILQAKRLIRTRRIAMLEEIETYHDRIRESTVAKLSEAEFKTHNRSLAKALENWDQAEPIALVQCWHHAGEDDKAGQYAALAAVDASKSLAFDRAAHHYKLALELKKNLTKAERLALLESRADALTHAGALLEAAEVFQQASQLADHFQSINLQRKALEQLLITGSLEIGSHLTYSVLRAVGVKEPSGHKKAIANFLWLRIQRRLKGYKFRPRAEAQIDPQILQKIDVCWSVSSALSLVSPLHGYIVQLQQMSIALEAGEPFRVAAALTMEMGFLGTAGPSKAARVRKLAEYAREVVFYSENPTADAFLDGVESLCFYLMGDFRSALTFATSAEEKFRQLGTLRWVANSCNHYRMVMFFYLGKIRQLTEEMPVLLKQAIEQGNHHLANSLRKWRANVMWLALDDPDEAARQAGSYSGVTVQGPNFHLHHHWELMAHTQILIYQGDGPGAWSLIEDSKNRLKRSFIKRVQPVRVEYAFAMGRCALASAVDDPTHRAPMLIQATRAIKSLNKEKVQWAKALASLLAASVAALQGQQPQAIEKYRYAEARLKAVNLNLFATIARLRRGILIGGAEGKELVRQATNWMRREAVRDIDRFAALYAPDHRDPLS